MSLEPEWSHPEKNDKVEHMSIPRRSFLLTGAGALSALSIWPRSTKAAEPVPSPARPENIIFLVSDGMSTGVLDQAEQLSQLVRGRGTAWCKLAAEPGTTAGLMETHSLNSTVTDSAAAASAWGSGSRVNNGVLNMLPDGTKLKTIGELIHESGRAVGLVTTATVTHATPAGFAASSESRNDEAGIATQYLNRVDVILGGGFPFFDKASREDGRDVLAEFTRNDYKVCRNLEELDAAKGGKLLGLFADSHLPYTIDQQEDATLQAEVPTLARMTEKALEALSANTKGFLLQVEAARVDHAAHYNDAPATIWDQIAFDDAVEVALNFAKAHGETLVIVTTDHGNANPGLNGHGPAYSESGNVFKAVAKAKCSFEVLHKQVQAEFEEGKLPDFQTLCRRIDEKLGFALKEDEYKALVEVLTNGEIPSWSYQYRLFPGLLGQIAANHFGIGWTGVTHTSDHIIFHVTGPGQEIFQGLIPNHAVFGKLCHLLQIDFQNPKAEPQTTAAVFQHQYPV